LSRRQIDYYRTAVEVVNRLSEGRTPASHSAPTRPSASPADLPLRLALQAVEWQPMAEAQFVAEELVIGVLPPTRAQRLVRRVVHMLQDEQARHQPGLPPRLVAHHRRHSGLVDALFFGALPKPEAAADRRADPFAPLWRECRLWP